jgi:hypothetical protein
MTLARCGAVVTGLIMLGYLVTRSPVIRFDSAFFVPDALLTVLLLVLAPMPRRWAVPALLFAFAWTAGIITVSLFTYVVRGEFAWGNFALVMSTLVLAGVLMREVAAGDGA